MNPAERVVFDCNIFFQALISPAGPAGQAFDAVVDGSCSLFVSKFIFDELKDITLRPYLVARFNLTTERVALFLESIAEIATTLVNVPAVFEFPRDPKDAHYVDLALAAQAKLIVSRDLDLLSLATPQRRKVETSELASQISRSSRRPSSCVYSNKPNGDVQLALFSDCVTARAPTSIPS